MTLDELIALQGRQGLGHVHLAYIGAAGFLLAHSDYERNMGVDLSLCGIHQWLAGSDGPPAPVGVYVVSAHEPDPVSESYRSDPWKLHPL